MTKAISSALDAWYIRIAVFLVLCLTVDSFISSAQSFSSPGEYNNYIFGDEVSIAQRYLAYISEIAHSNSLRRIERKRERLVLKVEGTYNKIVDAPNYKGDGLLRNAAIDFYKSLVRLLNDDYSKLTQLEDVSQDSYENLEAYYKTRNEAEKKYQAASEKLSTIQKEFAKKYQLQLTDNPQMKSLEEKFKTIDEVNNYYGKLHLMFFKAYKTEAGLMLAIKNKEYLTAEKKRQSLSAICKEALAQSGTLSHYANDETLYGALKNYLQHCLDEADVQLVKLLEFPKKQQVFEKVKGNLESTPKRERTKADIDYYNKAVNDFNMVVNEANSVAEKLNRDGQLYLNNWNNVVRSFMDKHIPHYEDEVETAKVNMSNPRHNFYQISVDENRHLFFKYESSLTSRTGLSRSFDNLWKKLAV